MTVHTVIIVGGNIGGLQTAHYLLRHTIPALQVIDSSISYEVKIITPNTKSYYKIAAPRAIGGVGKLDLSEIFLPIKEGFSSYAHAPLEIIQGFVTEVSESRHVTVKLYDGPVIVLSYDTLIVASGSKSSGSLWTLTGEYTDTKAAFELLQSRITTAKSVYIAGGGPAGVETAGEIAENHPQAKVVLLSGGQRLLPRLLAKSSHRAEAKLQQLGVEVLHGIRVRAARWSEKNGCFELDLDKEYHVSTDVYIDATGGVPNTSYLPKSWLDGRGAVSVDGKTLRGNRPGMESVYAIGDAGSYSSGGAIDVMFGVVPLASSIGADIASALNADTKMLSRSKKTLVQRRFNPPKNSQIVPVGSKGGVIQVLGWSLPSFFAWLLKSRDFMISGAADIVMGKNQVKA